MNLLSDISSELAVAILVEKKHSEEVSSKDALNLIGKIYEILEPISNEEELKNIPSPIKEAKATNH